MLLLNLGATGAILFFTVSYRFAFGGPTRANLTLPSGVDVSDITFAVAMSTGRDIKDENSLEEITAEDIDVAVRFLRRLLRMQSNIQLLQKISNMTATTKLMEPTTLAPKEESSVNDKDDYVNVVDGATDGSEFHYVAKNILQKSKNPSVADENVERSTGEAIESTTSGEDADPSVTTTTPQATGGANDYYGFEESGDVRSSFPPMARHRLRLSLFDRPEVMLRKRVSEQEINSLLRNTWLG
ncbi:hypothetical protein QR680_001335 [Steinernema hermaphroditum]|uniref:Uncharacterized protein n=1 Tax=Steinernema hermaphroditum TaxID=289476 RepID=A0AA39GXX9_9BILA|nr:hypothetical protein QR680_001335 [Steinernema hermaphroditum]